MATPIPANPRSIIDQVAGSGTAERFGSVKAVPYWKRRFEIFESEPLYAPRLKITLFLMYG